MLYLLTLSRSRLISTFPAFSRVRGGHLGDRRPSFSKAEQTLIGKRQTTTTYDGVRGIGAARVVRSSKENRRRCVINYRDVWKEFVVFGTLVLGSEAVRRRDGCGSVVWALRHSAAEEITIGIKSWPQTREVPRGWKVLAFQPNALSQQFMNHAKA